MDHTYAATPDSGAAERSTPQPASIHLDCGLTVQRLQAAQRDAARAERLVNEARFRPSVPAVQRQIAEPVLRAAGWQRDAAAAASRQRAEGVRARDAAQGALPAGAAQVAAQVQCQREQLQAASVPAIFRLPAAQRGGRQPSAPDYVQLYQAQTQAFERTPPLRLTSNDPVVRLQRAVVDGLVQCYQRSAHAGPGRHAEFASQLDGVAQVGADLSPVVLARLSPGERPLVQRALADVQRARLEREALAAQVQRAAQLGQAVEDHDRQTAVLARIQARSGEGQPLPPEVRRQLEVGLNTDVSVMRVLDDPEAHALSRAVGAKALTVGRTIMFGAGQYNPYTREGVETLGHEAWHGVGQQLAGRVTGHGIDPHPDLEAEAQHKGRGVASRWEQAAGTPRDQAPQRGAVPVRRPTRPTGQAPALQREQAPKFGNKEVGSADANITREAFIEQLCFPVVYGPLSAQAKTLLHHFGYAAGPEIQGADGFQMRVFTPLARDQLTAADRARLNDFTETLVVFRGTEAAREPQHDVTTDFNAQGVGINQFQTNRKVIERQLSAAHARSGQRSWVGGHSLGGSLAQLAAATFPSLVSRVITLNSPGISQAQVKQLEQYNAQHPGKRILSTHYRVNGDIVPASGSALTPGLIHAFKSKGAPNPLDWHNTNPVSAVAEQRHPGSVPGARLPNAKQHISDLGIFTTDRNFWNFFVEFSRKFLGHLGSDLQGTAGVVTEAGQQALKSAAEAYAQYQRYGQGAADHIKRLPQQTFDALFKGWPTNQSKDSKPGPDAESSGAGAPRPRIKASTSGEAVQRKAASKARATSTKPKVAKPARSTDQALSDHYDWKAIESRPVLSGEGTYGHFTLPCTGLAEYTWEFANDNPSLNGGESRGLGGATRQHAAPGISTMLINYRINDGDIQTASFDVGPLQTGRFRLPNPAAGHAADFKIQIDRYGQDGAQFITSMHAKRYQGQPTPVGPLRHDQLKQG